MLGVLKIKDHKWTVQAQAALICACMFKHHEMSVLLLVGQTDQICHRLKLYYR